MVYIIVAVVGATFAYFTATATGGESGGQEASVKTADVSNVTIATTNEDITQHDQKYPGVWLAAGISVKATYGGDHTENYDVTYTLNGKIDVSALKSEESTSKFKYNIYRVDQKNPVTSPIQSCSTHEADASNQQMYVENCALNSLLSEGTKLYEEDKEIDLSSSEGVETIAVASQKLAVEDAGDPTGTHYYLVLQYVNEGDQTSTDAGKDIKLQLSGVTAPVVAKRAV